MNANKPPLPIVNVIADQPNSEPAKVENFLIGSIATDECTHRWLAGRHRIGTPVVICVISVMTEFLVAPVRN